MRVVVVGAGSSGLAPIKALREQGLNVEAYERGSDVGGLWRYENDNGLSAPYASLRTNVSRRRMQYPSFAMPRSYGDFPSHAEMATYLSAYADAFALRDSIHFQTTVERLEPTADGAWSTTLDSCRADLRFRTRRRARDSALDRASTVRRRRCRSAQSLAGGSC